MSFCNCINLDKKNKKLFKLISLYYLIFICNYLIQIYFTLKPSNIFEKYLNPTAKILNIIPYIIIKKYYKDKSGVLLLKSKYSAFQSDNNLKDYIILCLIIIVFDLIDINEFALKETYFSIANTGTFILLILSLLKKFIDDFKFYSHRIISFILIFIFATIIDIFDIFYIKIINDIFSFSFLFMWILYIISYAIYMAYQKYLIDSKYVSYHFVCFLFGLIGFILLIFLEIIGNFLYYNNNKIIFTYLTQKTSQSIIIQLLKTIPSIALLFILF